MMSGSEDGDDDDDDGAAEPSKKKPSIPEPVLTPQQLEQRRVARYTRLRVQIASVCESILADP